MSADNVTYHDKVVFDPTVIISCHQPTHSIIERLGDYGVDIVAFKVDMYSEGSQLQLMSERVFSAGVMCHLAILLNGPTNENLQNISVSTHDGEILCSCLIIFASQSLSTFS